MPAAVLVAAVAFAASGFLEVPNAPWVPADSNVPGFLVDREIDKEIHSHC
jgi:hypothetical protein